LDAINIDLKSFRQDYYTKICSARVEPVKENIKYLWDKGMWVEVTTLIVTNHNDNEDEFKDIADFLVNISPDLPWHISRYFPAYKIDDPPTPIETLEKAYEIGKKAGLNYVYVGNVLGLGKENTYCPKCNELLIERYGYMVEDHMKKGKCPKCGHEIPGRFV
jgi:pyruvate formate lyase activating enzyme